MPSEEANLQLRQRRWNAAALQAYLRRGVPASFRMRLSDLQAAAAAIGNDLRGAPDPLELVHQAWAHLILTGLVTADAMGEGHDWMLADAPRYARVPAAAGMVAGERG
jgi:hypothetical protein